jgi:RNA polymerase sigma factor (sigma-70 family)
MQEDTNLVKQTIEGDEKAFHRLIMKYYTAIHALILSWVKNPEDAKDIVQDVFLEAYQGLSSLKKPEQFYFWLRQIAKYHFQDYLRKKKDFTQLHEDITCEMQSVDEVMILRETMAKMMQAIDELPESERQLLKEHYLDDASYDKLEAKYGLSQSVLSMRLYRARQRVREEKS